jgi:hypothetical protein
VLQGLPPFLTAIWNSPEELAIALRWLTIVGIVFTATFGAAIYFVNDRIGALQGTQIRDQGTEIKSQGLTVKSQSQTISKQNEQISQLTNDLNSVNARATELAAKAQNAERGISDTYDFNGGHRQNMGGGRLGITVGAEVGIFQKIMELYKAKDWETLKDTCEAQIKTTPTWLTPYLFSGIAYVNLGQLAKAKERLEFVSEKAGDDPQYSDAARILGEIKSMPQH